MVRIVYFLRAALSGLRQSLFVHFVSALTIGIALFAIGLARFGVVAVERALDSWGAEVQVTLYLADGVRPEDARGLVDRLQREDGGEVRLVTPEEALERLRRDLGGDGDVLVGLPKNPLPASIEVRPPQPLRSAGALSALAARWTTLPGVSSVEYGREWVERLEGLGRGVKGAGAVLLILVLLAAVVVVAATLQLAIHARREEIEIQKLVGATDPFVKAPFLLEGMFQGFLGAALACAGLFALGHFLGPHVARAVSFALEGLAFPPLVEPRGAAQLVGAGVSLGLLGSLLAVRRFLRV